jgi:hypothetical protein
MFDTPNARAVLSLPIVDASPFCLGNETSGVDDSLLPDVRPWLAALLRPHNDPSGAHRKPDGRPEEGAEGRGNERAKSGPVRPVDAGLKDEHARTLRSVAVVDRAEDEDGEDATETTNDDIESVEEGERWDKAKQDRREDSCRDEVRDKIKYWEKVSEGRSDRRADKPRMFTFLVATTMAGTLTIKIRRTHQMLILFRKTSLPTWVMRDAWASTPSHLLMVATSAV